MSSKFNTIAFEFLGAALGDPVSQRAVQERINSTMARLRGQITQIGYEAPQGAGVAWTGDDEAPYVKVINSPLNPVQITTGGGAIDVDATIVAPLPLPVDVTNTASDPVQAVETLPPITATGAYSVAYEPGGASTEVCKATQGVLFQLYVFNPTGGSLTFQIHNTAAAPGAGAVPFMTPWTLPTLTALFVDFGVRGIYMSTGIVMASSSAYATFTSSAGLHMTGLFE
jgi:hypothetical protein